MSRSTSRSVRYSRLRLPTVTFTEVGAALRSREFSMETALPPVRTVTDYERSVTDLDGQGQRRPILPGQKGRGHLVALICSIVKRAERQRRRSYGLARVDRSRILRGKSSRGAPHFDDPLLIAVEAIERLQLD